MGHTANRVRNVVVDLVLEVDSRGIGVEDLARRIRTGAVGPRTRRRERA
jgi:hypothetical protein